MLADLMRTCTHARAVHNIHPWWDMENLTAPFAAPASHKILLDTRSARILNVYEPPLDLQVAD